MFSRFLRERFQNRLILILQCFYSKEGMLKRLLMRIKFQMCRKVLPMHFMTFVGRKFLYRPETVFCKIRKRSSAWRCHYLKTRGKKAPVVTCILPNEVGILQPVIPYERVHFLLIHF